MSRIKSTPKTELFNRHQAEANAMGEHNDCAVKALATVAGVEYSVAHGALRLAGRKKGKGTYANQIMKALALCDCTATRVDPQHFIAQYPGAHSNLQSVTSHHMDRFNKVWADGKTYLIFTRGHVLAVVDGVNHDWTKGRAMRAYAIYEIIKG